MTMDVGKIRQILPMTTLMGEVETDDHADWEAVDMLLTTVSVHRETAERYREKLVHALDDGIGPEYESNLADGPSYIHLGAELGDQGYALRLMALGSVLGLWTIMSGLSVKFPREQATQMAGVGFLYAVGWKAPVPA